MACIVSSSMVGGPLRVVVPRSPVRSAVVARRAVRVVLTKADSKAAVEDTKAALEEKRTELLEIFEGALEKAQAYWEASDEKPAIVAVSVGSLLAVYFAGSIVDAVDRLPLVSTLLELVGLAFSGWTAYRFFLVEGERAKMASEVKGFAKKVGINIE